MLNAARVWQYLEVRHQEEYQFPGEVEAVCVDNLCVLARKIGGIYLHRYDLHIQTKISNVSSMHQMGLSQAVIAADCAANFQHEVGSADCHLAVLPTAWLPQHLAYFA